MSLFELWYLPSQSEWKTETRSVPANDWMGDVLTGHESPPPSNVRPLRELLALITDMNEHELGAVLFLARRLAKGRKVYGPLNPHDGRDWLQEAAEEFADLLVYAYAAKEASK